MANEQTDILRAARDKMVDARRGWAKVLGEPFDRSKTPDARAGLVEMQEVIEAIDRAIEDELRKPS